MKLPILPSLSLALALLSVPLSAADRAAEDLIAKIEESQDTRGAMIRAKLSIEDAKSGRTTSAQIRIRLRRDAKVTRLLYQVLWPSDHKGEALSLERSARGAITGFLYDPPEKITPVNASTMSRPYLDSNLTIEDLGEDFWQWPSQRISGEEMIGGEACKIVESRPPAGVRSSYSLIRSWISPSKLLPLRIEKFGRDERLAKRFTVQKTSRHDGHWVPVTTVIQNSGGTLQTTLDFSRGERDVEIPVEEFSPERIKRP
jgi:hypothetical protein